MLVMYGLGTWVDNWTFKVKVYPDYIYFLNIFPSTAHPFFFLFKSTLKLVLVHLSTCFPLWLFLSPLFVLNSAFSVQKLFSCYFAPS